MGKLFFRAIEAAPRNLQTLYMLRLDSWSAEYEFPKFTSLRKLGVSFEGSQWSKLKVFLDASTVPHKLEILRLDCHYGDRNIRHNMAKLNLCSYENLCRLHLGVSMVKLPELPPNLTKLTLHRTQLEEDPMETLKKLTKLKILKLSYYSYAGEKMIVCSSGEGPDDNFPQLQVLEIMHQPLLMEFIIMDDDNVMPRLNQLTFLTDYREDLVVRTIPKRITDKMIIIPRRTRQIRIRLGLDHKGRQRSPSRKQLHTQGSNSRPLVKLEESPDKMITI